jgi:hypothetical protein
VPLKDVLKRAGKPRARSIQAVIGRNISLQPAVFDLKRMGPHFAVVGPPLSGKTTVLFNWVLSLTERYDPEKVMIILVDLQQRFVDYGGEHRLDELPHVVSAVTEVEQLETMVANLKTECEALAAEDSEREIFVIIDNFDDFSEEVERMRDLPRDLAGMARRYGRDGLHFIIGGTLDSGVSELRRRVQSANYGIGLRSAQAVDALRVTRRPAALRGKELPPGRGFIVKSGQPTMIQVAAPYDGLGASSTGGELEDEEAKIAQAMDGWVKGILKKHPEKRAEWSEPLPTAAADGDGIVVDSETKPIIDLLKRVIFKQADGDQDEIASWDDKAVLIKFVKDALGQESGLDPGFFGTSVQEILDAAAGYFPEISGNGAEEVEEEKAQ